MNVPDPSSSQPAFDGVELAPGVWVPESGMRFQFARSGGPGGQNVNKVNTKAELWVRVEAIVGMTFRAKERLARLAGRKFTDAGEIHIAAETERSQQSNRAAALERLRELIIAARHEPKVRRKTKPSRASKQRRLDAKKRNSDIKSGRRGDW